MNAAVRSGAPCATPPVQPGLSPEMNRLLSTLRERHARVQSRLGHAPSAADQEAARVMLGEIAQLALTGQAMLPDPCGLREGPAVHRIVRAVAVFERDHRGPADRAQLAALIETTPQEAQCLLRRARLKGWVSQTGGAWGRWGLTAAGAAFLGRASPLLPDRFAGPEARS